MYPEHKLIARRPNCLKQLPLHPRQQAMAKDEPARQNINDRWGRLLVVSNTHGCALV